MFITIRGYICLKAGKNSQFKKFVLMSNFFLLKYCQDYNLWNFHTEILKIVNVGEVRDVFPKIASAISLNNFNRKQILFFPKVDRWNYLTKQIFEFCFSTKTGYSKTDLKLLLWGKKSLLSWTR